MRGFARIAALIGVVVALSACPPQKPAPNNGGGGAGGAPPSPPVLVGCAQACVHADSVCPGNSCLQFCPVVSKVDPGYIPCIMSATGCYCCDSACRDAGTTIQIAGPPQPHGR